MATQKPLAELIPDILEHINRYNDYLEFNLRLYRVAEGLVKEEVEKSLSDELISKAAYERAKQRIPSINMIKKAADKLSKVYIEKPKRLADNMTDAELLETISKSAHLDTKLHSANFILNVHRSFALEPYVENRQHKVRVLAGHQFLPYSDDPVDPQRMTVFIKLLGSEIDRKEARFDETGRLIEREEIREVGLYAIYSDDEWAVIDTGGRIRSDKMAEMGVMVEPGRVAVNPFGRIPYVYANTSNFELIPFPNQQGYDISILIPKLMADLNYAAQFMSHSIIWAKNTDLEGQELNPDAVVNLGTSVQGEGEPELGSIKPEVDINEILGLIEFTAQGYFSSLGIKVSTQGTMANGRDSSALAKALDEGDVTAERKVQTEFFRKIELELWSLLASMQAVYAANNEVDERRLFTDQFVDTFRIQFAEMRPVKTFNQKIEEVKGLRDLKLITRKRALQMLMPDLTEAQIEQWVEDLDDEAVEQQEKMLSFAVERGNSGQFRPENQAAANQDETSKDETDMDERVN